MRENLQTALTYILADEGGFAERAEEPGGGVNKGVSLQALQEWRARKGLPEPSMDDLRNLTTEEAMQIYEQRYWTSIRGDQLPSGLDYAMLNAAVMEGPRAARIMLNSAIGLPAETPIDQTVEALAGNNPDVVTAKFVARHFNKKLHSKGRTKFGGGWGNRLTNVADRTSELRNSAASS